MINLRVFVESFGCSTNQSDGAVLRGCLAQAGYVLKDSVKEADIVVYNTCGVKSPTENRLIELCKRVPPDKKLIVTGCLPLINSERLKNELRFDGIVGPAAGMDIVETVKRVANGQKVLDLDGSSKRKPSLALPRLQASPVVSVIPISYGCLGSCAYCCVVFARGSLRSYEIKEIVERVEDDYNKGFHEFWLTAQDTASYGRDLGANLAQLLNSLNELKGDFTIRLGMMAPNSIKDILEEMIEAFRDERVFKFVHLPVQSGDDGVLKRMNRFYSVDDFTQVVQKLRNEYSDLTLATDVICGFPGERKDDFERTLRLIKEVKSDIVNVSKFFPRPRTLAAGMYEDIVSQQEILRRSRMAATLSRTISLERNRKWIGWKGKILIDEPGKIRGSWVGRNFAYKPIAIRSEENVLGKLLHVKIVRAFPTYLEGYAIEDTVKADHETVVLKKPPVT